MTAILDPLDMRLVTDPHGMPLLTRMNRQIFNVLSRFRVQSDEVATWRRENNIPEPDPSLPGLIETPAGTLTDLCSKPQVVLSLLGDNEQEPSVPHDTVYGNHCVPRDVADRMLRELCLFTGVPHWKAELIYEGVRIGGGSHWDPEPAANDSAVPVAA